MTKVLRLAIFAMICTLCGCTKDDPGILNITSEAARDSLDQFFLNPKPHNLVIKNVSIVSVESGTISDKMDVFVLNKKIDAIVSAGAVPADGFITVDGTGKYLLPGFADMHVHVYPGKDLSNDLFLFLAKGITRVRVMWGSRYHVALRDSINKGLKVGPRMFVASGGFDGTSQFWPGSIVTHSSEEVRTSIDALKEIGFDYVKVYSSLPHDQYFELITYAWKQGMPPVGHVPIGVDAFEAVRNRQSSIEHFSQVAASAYGAQVVFESSVGEDVYFCPTLTVLNRVVASIPTYQTPWLDHVSGDGRNFFERTRGLIPPTNQMFERNKALFQRLIDVQGNIISGTDTGIRYVLPGISLHEELQYYTQAGMSAVDVIKTTTVNVSNYLGEDKSDVEIGAIADLVLLYDNPLADIKNTEKISGVIVGGQWISSSQIDHILQLIKAYNRKS